MERRFERLTRFLCVRFVCIVSLLSAQVTLHAMPGGGDEDDGAGPAVQGSAVFTPKGLRATVLGHIGNLHDDSLTTIGPELLALLERAVQAQAGPVPENPSLEELSVTGAEEDRAGAEERLACRTPPSGAVLAAAAATLSASDGESDPMPSPGAAASVFSAPQASRALPPEDAQGGAAAAAVAPPPTSFTPSRASKALTEEEASCAAAALPNYAALLPLGTAFDRWNVTHYAHNAAGLKLLKKRLKHTQRTESAFSRWQGRLADAQQEYLPGATCKAIKELRPDLMRLCDRGAASAGDASSSGGASAAAAPPPAYAAPLPPGEAFDPYNVAHYARNWSSLKPLRNLLRHTKRNGHAFSRWTGVLSLYHAGRLRPDVISRIHQFAPTLLPRVPIEDFTSESRLLCHTQYLPPVCAPLIDTPEKAIALGRRVEASGMAHPGSTASIRRWWDQGWIMDKSQPIFTVHQMPVEALAGLSASLDDLRFLPLRIFPTIPQATLLDERTRDQVLPPALALHEDFPLDSVIKDWDEALICSLPTPYLVRLRKKIPANLQRFLSPEAFAAIQKADQEEKDRAAAGREGSRRDACGRRG